ncbi:AAA family ATPase [Streptomyces sp. NPDC018031]|uniref:AAA family ATPase n=1 Tax=Streptomyces sp. NPDC018031 TaxID=3365033 RepID=UPI0037A402FA
MGTTTHDEVIATEQKAVDHAYRCYEGRLAEMNAASAATASASGKDGIANRKEAEARAAAYGGLGDEALVFARVDAPEEPGARPRPWYVGRRVVHDADKELVVLPWTSPLAKRWSEALPEAPGEVVLRRQLRCVRRIVEGYFDEIAAASPAAPAPVAVPAPVPGPRRAPGDTPEDTGETGGAGEAEDAPGSEAPRETGEAGEPGAAGDSGVGVPPDTSAGPAGTPRPAPARRGEHRPDRTPGDVARAQRRKPLPPDDFLLRELQRSRSGRMRDIVETIRRDQMDLVTGSPSDILVVQGGPGTGKSAVGLHRVTWLVGNEHFAAQDILVIGPHQRFLDYVGQVLPTLGTRDVNAVQLARLWDGEIRGTDTPGAARRVKSDERMAAVLRRRVEHECRPEALDDLTTAPSFEGDEPAVVVTAGSTTLRVPRAEVLALLDRARAGEGPYRQRRDHFRSLFVDRLLQELAAVAPRRGQGGAIRRDLERNRRVERLVERVWPSPGAREALRTLYDSPELLRTCADGLLDDEEQAALHRPRAATADADPWTLEDHVCLEELRFLISGEIPRRYGHIVIDEAQDLTPMQARALRRRCAAGGSMTVLGDLAQATGPHTPADWDRLGALLSDHGDWRVAELNTSYRVPAEIMEFVAPLARAVAPALPRPRAVRAAGPEAVRVLASEPWKLLDDIVTQVTRLVGTSDGRTLRSVAVLVPDDSEWITEISRLLDGAEVTGPRRETVSVLPAAQAKGMEYDHVLVVEPTTLADRGPVGLRQLYIALTRSTQTLTVLHTAPLPAALTERAAEPPAPEGAPVPGDGTGPDAAPGPDGGFGRAPGAAPDGGPEIGTDIRVRVLGPGPGGRYKVKALAPTIDRPLVLTVRHGSTPPRPGEELDCWVFANETGHSVLTADQRGRRPISPAMAERYVAALGVLDEIVNGDGEIPGDTRARLSELQGMANRVLRRDQADWVDVRRVLGSPDRHRVGVLRTLAAGVHRALKDHTLDIPAVRQELAESGWADALPAAREVLLARLAAVPARQPAPEPDRQDGPDTGPGAPADPATGPAPEAPARDGTVTLAPDSAVAPARDDERALTASRPARREHQSEQKETEPVTTVEEDPVAPAPTAEDGFLRALENSASADRTCKKHEAVRHALKSALLWADIEPSDSPVVDVSCVTDRGVRLYEVLGAGHSTYRHLRSGATRLLEIDHTLPTRAAVRYLVLCEPPAEDWSADTTRDVFGVHVLWRTPEGWGGQEAGNALGSAGA